MADGAITSVVEESLGNVVLTQAYNKQRDEEKRLDREARAWLRASVRGARLGEQFVEVVETLRVLAVIGLGVWEIPPAGCPSVDSSRSPPSCRAVRPS